MAKMLRVISIVLWIGSAFAGESERILSYHSHIRVHDDGSMTVTETIAVHCEGDKIRRGIYRDFPTIYRDRYQNRVRIGFQLIGVFRDNVPEPARVAKQPKGLRIYIGQEDVFLRPGNYTYRLRYRTWRQIGYFDQYDELYWNVTGNDWAFDIERASATVELPSAAAARIRDSVAYTGEYGSRERAFRRSRDSRNNIIFTATRRLNAGEGLTIALSWPKGVVAEPTASQKLSWFFSDNTGLFAFLIGLIVIFVFYLFSWSRVGVDPEKGLVVPRYNPPEHLSPAAIRYIRRMGFDHKAFTAALISMAVKGYLTISEHDGVYTLARTDAEPNGLGKAEIKIAGTLFRSRRSLKLENRHHQKIGKAMKAMEKSLAAQYHRVMFYLNRSVFIGGAVLSAVVLIACAIVTGNPVVMGMGAWLSLWSVGVVFLAVRVVRSWRAARYGGRKLAAAAIFNTLFALPFFIGELFGGGMLAVMGSPMFLIFTIILVGINITFYYLLKAPTRTGRVIMDQIEGFRLYLSVAERERLNFIHPPQETPRLFEKYLPYALALDVEQQWAEQFAELFARSEEYTPEWYSGNAWSAFAVSQFTSSLGHSFASAVSSASTAPGSSSGSGGGGFSGGGGGGGGGGGW